MTKNKFKWKLSERRRFQKSAWFRSISLPSWSFLAFLSLFRPINFFNFAFLKLEINIKQKRQYDILKLFGVPQVSTLRQNFFSIYKIENDLNATNQEHLQLFADEIIVMFDCYLEVLFKNYWISISMTNSTTWKYKQKKMFYLFVF